MNFKKLLLLTVLLPGLQLMGQDAPAQEVLTNDAVIQMVQAHLSVDVIVEQIRTSPGRYSLTSSSLIRLKQQGVPDKVIAAMQAKHATASQPPSLRTSANEPPALPQADTPSSALRFPKGQWQVRDREDPLTRMRTREAIMVANADSNGRHGEFEVTVACDTEGISFQIVYLSNFDKDLGFSVTQPDPTIAFGQVYSHRPRVNLRMRVDSRDVEIASPTADHINQVTLKFTRRSRNTVGGLLSMLDAAGLASDVLNARIIRVELPLSNGDTPVLEIRPQDPSFRKFALQCSDPAAGTDSRAGSRDTGMRDANGNPILTYPGDTRMFDAHGNVYEPGPPHSTDGFIFGSSATRASRIYRGTVEGFAAALPSFIQRAVAASGLPAQNYEAETAYIIGAARACAGITPEMAAGVSYHGYADPTKLGEPYRVCGVGYHTLRKYDRERERGLMMIVVPIGNWGQGFTIAVEFTGRNGDTVVPLPSLFDAYGVVFASIELSVKQ